MSKTTVYPTASICKKLESNNLFKIHISCGFIQHNVRTGHKIPYDVQSNSSVLSGDEMTWHQAIHIPTGREVWMLRGCSESQPSTY